MSFSPSFLPGLGRPDRQPAPPRPVGRQERLPLLPLFLAPFAGLAYFGLLGLILPQFIHAVVLGTFPIHQGKYRQDEQALVMAVTTNSRGNLHPASEWIGSPLYLQGDHAGSPRTRDNPSG